MTDYFTSDFERCMSLEDLRDADRDTQLDVMRTWFRQNYEDPAQRTPYESAEGGYIWIYGGPYDAREEIEGAFYEVVPIDVIEELVDELEYECTDWTSTPNSDDYDDYLIDDIAQITEYYHNFSGSILDIEKLLTTSVDGSVADCFYRLLFVNVITALETYLSDAFISTVATNNTLMRRFIETTPEFKSEKVSMADIYSAIENVEKRARSYLADVVWHSLDRVKQMYRATLGVEFPDDVGEIFKAILKRHDIVHRNGKTKDGKEILITQADIEILVAAVEKFVQNIDPQIAEARSNNAINPDA